MHLFSRFFTNVYDISNMSETAQFYFYIVSANSSDK